MPDLCIAEGVAKVRCFGRGDVLDALGSPPGTLRGRVAPDEIIFVGAPGTAAALVERLEAELAGEGDRALVVDHTDGWAFMTLAGTGSEVLFARVSHVRLPAPAEAPELVMGRICDVAGKAFVRPGRIDLMCGAEAAVHVQERLEHAGAALGLRHVDAAADPVGASGVPA